MSELPVLIIGAGISGLCLANGLKKRNIPFQVFEKDTDVTFRPQGYRVRLASDGADALKQCLSTELYTLFEQTCADVEVGAPGVIDPGTGESLAPREVFGAHRPPGHAYTVDRSVLRNVLLTGLEQNRVSWGKQFQKSEVTPDGVVSHFTDGSTVRGSLLVGAEGARSRVRSQVFPQIALLDTEGCLIYSKTPMTDDFIRAFSEDALRKMSLVTDRSQPSPLHLLLEKIHFNRDRAADAPFELPVDYVYWVLMMPHNLLSQHGIPLGSFHRSHGEEALGLATKLTADWTLKLTSLFKYADPTLTSTIHVLTTHPDIPDWKASKVTIIGDAAHVMPPTGAAGAASALQDAATLCRELENKGVGIEAVAAYEEEMKTRMREVVKASLGGAKRLLDTKDLDELKPVKS
ncbi:FAD/NAD(P)-binding domain-containing protein [Rhizodiscina lignyota]|uniref:FAD/NAD(P)-binding domain-containing protein n=1 Tax=Rhizodiscina lignyota TaxID=1504668 RepID=A0A9P4I773_9PEZI|nr:FAD/NAD(P)-binding domain-containing protein [Rhizodiscina lignyota]